MALTDTRFLQDGDRLTRETTDFACLPGKTENNGADFWTFLIKNNIIDTDNVLELIMANKREKIRKLHPYVITAPSKDGGRWQTYYRDKGGKRKIIRAQTEEELLDKLIPVYLMESHLDKMTFHELYEEWLEYKQTVTNSPNTIKRHKQHYHKYLELSVLDKKRLRQVDELLLETECNRIVKDFNLSRKEWCNVKTILNGMFTYAVRKKYLDENLMQKVTILIKFKQVVRKTGKTETYNTEELESLNQFLDQMYTETNDTSFLAVRINFFLGLRVGELVALKWDDIIDERHLHIQREEVRNQVTNEISVVEHTKTNRDRFVILVPKTIELLKKIESQGDYIFMKDGKRITSIRISSVLRKYANYQGVHMKSSHKIRKTFASNLNAAGVPLDYIRELLGHSDLNTTLGYIYNPLTEKETYDLVSKAL